jgi:hypothetical protein
MFCSIFIYVRNTPGVHSTHSKPRGGADRTEPLLIVVAVCTCTYNLYIHPILFCYIFFLKLSSKHSADFVVLAYNMTLYSGVFQTYKKYGLLYMFHVGRDGAQPIRSSYLDHYRMTLCQ